ncbi:MAG: HepT-like ribonuclease domain-containing protein [Xenococcaceae cyanobacterium]
MTEKYPEIHWRDIFDFRNLLARYWRIDLNVIWAIL